MTKAKDEAIKEFKSSGAYTKLLDKTYAVGFEDFHLNAREAFLGVDFNSIKLPIAGKSSLLPSTSKDVDLNDDATTSYKPKNNAHPMDAV